MPTSRASAVLVAAAASAVLPGIDGGSLVGAGVGAVVNSSFAARAESCSTDEPEPPFSLKKSKELCSFCLLQGSKCQWCPHSQSCERKGWLGGDAKCMGSAGDMDKPVGAEEGCKKWPSWLDDFEKQYGRSLLKENADMLRCIQGRLGWQVMLDEGMPTETPDEMASFGCMSAVIREGILGALGDLPLSSAEVLLAGNASSVRGESSSEPRALSDSDWEVTRHSTMVCKILAQISPKTPCQVDILGKSDFAMLRKKATSPDGVGPPDVSPTIVRSMISGPLVSFKPGAGKSGSGFGRSWDSLFKIKWGLRSSSRMMETDNLLKLLKGQHTEGATPLREHLRRNPRSLLNRYYAFVRIKIMDIDTYCLLMQDAAYNLEEHIRGKGMTVVRYDLKGKSRSLTKKQDKKSQFTLINGDFMAREHNQLAMKNWQCKMFQRIVRADANWLNAHSMIDYSLFIVIATSHGSSPAGCWNMPGTPFCTVSNKRTTTISIIDYLNDFNFYKKAESVAGKFTNYSGKIIDFADMICPVDKKESVSSLLVGLLIAIVIVVLLGFAAALKYASSFIFLDVPYEARQQQVQQQPQTEMTTMSRMNQPWAGPGMVPGYAPGQARQLQGDPLMVGGIASPPPPFRIIR